MLCSFHILCQNELISNISKFSKWPPFWGSGALLNRKLYRSYGYFKIWPTFWSCDLVMEPLSCKCYRVLCCGRLHMWTTFGDDWSKTATCIPENVTISFKHEYRGHTLTSRCDVIGDVIIMKIILVDDLHTIFLHLCQIKAILKTAKFFKLTKIWGPGELFHHKCHRKYVILTG